MSQNDEFTPSAASQDFSGKNVVDFPRMNIAASVRRSIRLLPRSKRRQLFFASGVQVSLGLLDLLGVLLVGVLASVAISATGIASVPEQIQAAMDAVGLGGFTATQLSALLAVLTVLVLITKTGLAAILQRLIFRFLANRQAEVSARLARAFLRRPLTDVQRWTEPEAIYALSTGVGAATVSLLGSAITISAESFLFLIIGISLLIVDPILTVVVIALLTGIVLLSHRQLTKRGTYNAQIMTEASIGTIAAISEALQTYREATVLNRRDLYLARYERLIGSYAKATASTSYILEIPKYVLEATLYLAILVLAAIQFLTRDLASAVATVAIFLAAGTRVTPALLRLQGAGITIRNASVQAQPTFHLADFLHLDANNTSMPVISHIPSALEIRDQIAAGHNDFNASIVVENVYVTYADSSHPALVDASFVAPPGTSVALVGSTGAGKSTLADVVLGVLQPDSGRVTISGLDPRVAITRWPGAISYVPQQVALVFGTVRDNVALGLPREAIDDQLVWEALDRAHIGHFLKDSREGLDTIIGERGVRLSGGQRQRLGIARALYTRPSLVVLDEATSALDAETERAIIRTLDELKGTVTTITVAHRLATVRRSHQVLYLQSGRIICSGSFDDVRKSVKDFDRQASLLGL